MQKIRPKLCTALIIMLFSISLAKAQEDVNWMLLKETSEITIHYSSGNCGETLLFLKAERKSSDIQLAELILEIEMDGQAQNVPFTLTFDVGDTFMYDCNRPPHVNPSGILPFSESAQVKFISLNLQTL